MEEFMKELKGKRRFLTIQQFRTIRGQAKAGNVEAARKGLERVLRRREQNGYHEI